MKDKQTHESLRFMYVVFYKMPLIYFRLYSSFLDQFLAAVGLIQASGMLDNAVESHPIS